MEILTSVERSPRCVLCDGALAVMVPVAIVFINSVQCRSLVRGDGALWASGKCSLQAEALP